jgi:hypothetical protein
MKQYDRPTPELAAADVTIAHRLDRIRYRSFLVLRGDPAAPTSSTRAHLRHIADEVEVIERELGIA